MIEKEDFICPAHGLPISPYKINNKIVWLCDLCLVEMGICFGEVENE